MKRKNWTTGFFLFDIGLFQGCVLSTIKVGHIFKTTPSESTLAKALTLSSRNTDDIHMQLLVDLTVTWLKWQIVKLLLTVIKEKI